MTQLSVQKGKTVTLDTHIAGLQTDDEILWIYNEWMLLQVHRGKLRRTSLDERFKDRLHLDRETGSPSVRDISVHDAGVYQLRTIRGDKAAYPITINLYVYANNVSCTVECSVKNGRDVTLSWSKGEERLYQTSSPDLSSNISLHLEMKDQDGDTYSCVAENPISNQTVKLHKTELCPGLPTNTNFCNHPWDILVPGLLVAVAVVMVGAVALYRKFKWRIWSVMMELQRPYFMSENLLTILNKSNEGTKTMD
ncbi:SLAM family member 5-like [Osmerus eperlanus]|uniref:SLAM family member 5-like n=1 Tax=Osmerus eperlanus TaxID=29151 RepID=UPI002E0D6729